METQEPKSTEPSINHAQGETKFEVEAGQHAGIPARDRTDDDNLMLLGKKPVLKVHNGHLLCGSRQSDGNDSLLITIFSGISASGAFWDSVVPS
jgi:hypothetical protein